MGHKHPLADCSNCPFEHEPFVPTQNLHPRLPIAVIGEAPGAFEAERGIPFTGPSGKLLNQVLDYHDIKREDVMVSNICLCLEHDTLVRLADGSNDKIGNLVRNRYDGEVLSELNGKLVTRRVVGWYKSGLHGRRILKVVHADAKNNVHSKSGMQLTNDHTILTKRGFIRADELIVGTDEICTGLREFNGKARQLLISARLGDGQFYTSTSYQESHSDAQLEYLEYRRNLLSKYNATDVRKYGKANVYRLQAHADIKRIVSLSNVELVKQLNWFGFALWFLDDGYLRPDKWYSEIAITRMSLTEAEEIASIISEKFTECYVRNTKIGPRLMFSVGASKDISENIAKYTPKCLRYKIHPQFGNIEFCAEEWVPVEPTILYSRVVSVEEVESPYQTVYCIDVKDTHRFITVGGVVHNCRPEDNADPPATAVAACKPRLDAELKASGVDKILAVGGTAATNLIETKRTITNIRIGGPKPYKENPSVEVVATWHPAYCLRAPDSFPSFVSDVAKLNGWTDVDWPEPNYRVFTDGTSIREAIRRLHTVEGNFIIDIETGIDKDTTVVHPENYDLLCLGIAYAKGKAVVLGGSGLQDSQVRHELGALLRSKRLVGHNGKFDLGGLFPVVGPLKLYGDTMLMSYATDERPGHHGLKKLAIEKLGAPDYEEEIRKHVPRGGNYADIPPDVLYKYNAFDVACTWDLYELFESTMSEREKGVHRFLIRASNALMNLERAGIHFDLDYNGLLSDEFVKELYNLELEINEIVDRALNPRSWQQIQAYLFENNVMVTSTEAEVLEAVLPYVSGKPYEFIEKILLHRKRAKLYGTYVKGLSKKVYDGKIYTTYSLHGTTSGRLASKNPNLQNIARDKRIKNQFVVEYLSMINGVDYSTINSTTFVQADYKQAEGRVIATLAQDEYLAELFRDPTKDIFDQLCDQIYGKHDDNEERVKIKKVFYGLAYGRGPVAIAKELDITEKEGRELLKNFKALIPATVAWQASITHRVLSGEDLSTPFGRKRSFWLITDQNRSDVLNEALSFLPQSIASDICLSALIDLQPKLEGLATTRLTVHDALYFECKKTDKDEVAAIATKSMVDAGLAFTDYVPFAVDVKFGERWSAL